MTEPGDRAEQAALWRRWRSETQAPLEPGVVDPLLLAAYAEGRLDEAAAEPVEGALAAMPALLEDIAAARQAAGATLPVAPEAIIAKAASLVAAASETVIPLRSGMPRRGGWRTAFAWSGIAASLMATSLFGFTLGSNAYLDLAGHRTAVENTLGDLLDPPSSLFTTDEDQAI